MASHYNFTDTNKIDIYSKSLDNSLEVIQLKKLCKSKKIRFEEPKKFYNGKKASVAIVRKCCDILIDVTFNQPYIEYQDVPKCEQVSYFCNGQIKPITRRKVKEIEPSDLRIELYNNGFVCDGIKYIEYKRSASRARQGSTLFIRADLYNEMMKWSHMGLSFEKDEQVDLTSLRAYEALTMSGIESTVNIDTKTILMIEDATSTFTAMVSSTEINNNQLITATKDCQITNTIWDGQSLLDVSIFDEAGYTNQGMMLLRNRFYKSCAFNTNLQQWFKDNNIDVVYDMFGCEHKASDIMMITTPSSLKLFKFAYKIGSKQECFDFWVKNAGSKFGIVKTEHSSKFNEVNQLAYQYINSLPLTESDIDALYGEFERNYINNIRYDDQAFLNHIGIKDDSSTHSHFYNDLVSINPEILKTQELKNWRYSIINHYKERLKKGKIKLTETDYCTVVGNPFEMLQASILPTGKQTDIDNMIHPLEGWQISCNAYDNGFELAGFRSPHICSGNVVHCTNIIDDNISQYFNFSKNIAVLNSINTDFLNRGQGSDFDSDSYEFTSNHIIVEKAKECQQFPTPVNNTGGGYTRQLQNNSSFKADVDNKLSENKIGEIVNLSQVLNSYYWDYLYQGTDKTLLDEIYDDISKLSTLSQIELDRAKKGYTLDTAKCLKSIRKKPYIKKGEKLKSFRAINSNIQAEIETACKLWLLSTSQCTDVTEAEETAKQIKTQEKFLQYCQSESVNILKEKYNADSFCVFSNKVQIRPLFFSGLGANNSNNPYIYQKMHCPMDMLVELINTDKKVRSTKNTKTIPMMDFLIDTPVESVNKRQLAKLREIVEQVSKTSNTNSQNNLFEEYSESLQKLKINQATVYHLLKLTYGAKTNSKFTYGGTTKRYTIKMLYSIAPDTVISCFKKAV